MKNKIILGFFTAAIFYSCTAKKAAAPTQEVKEIATAVEVAMVEPAKDKHAALAEGKSLYEANCAKCHKLFDAKDFTAEEWTPIVMSMQKKARISDEQRDKIYAYLTKP